VGLTIFFVLQAPFCYNERKLLSETENLLEVEPDEPSA